MKRLTIFSAIVPVITAVTLTLTGCRSEGGPWEENVLTYDIVRLASQDNTSGTTFTLTLPDADQLITYRVDHPTIDPNKVNIGERLMLAYRLSGNRAPYTSGAIIPVGYSTIINADLLETENMEEEYPDFDRDPIYLLSMWRSETCINLHFRAAYSEKPRTFALVMEAGEADAEMPSLTVAHTLAEGENPENFMRESYASFDIAEVWERATCRGVTVTINNSNLPQRTFTFMKP